MPARERSSLLRRNAALKAAATVRRRKAEELARRRKAAQDAWVTMRSAPFRARKTSLKSQEALRLWAKSEGWYVVFLDAASGNPRTGIVDAVLLRIAKRSPDELEVRLVQLKGGSGGLTASEVTRLENAATVVAVKTVCAFHDGECLRFQEPWAIPLGPRSKPAAKARTR
jgi:hypothetical protein